MCVTQDLFSGAGVQGGFIPWVGLPRANAERLLAFCFLRSTLGPLKLQESGSRPVSFVLAFSTTYHVHLMPLPSSSLLFSMYHAMLAMLGPSGWWPAQGAFEVAVGAILTQNTSWTNVEKAIDNLRRQGLLAPERLCRADLSTIEECIRPSGYFRQKTKKIRDFLDFLEHEQALDFKAFTEQNTSVLRDKLLNVRGIGPETADSILLYALERPVFVVDAYTARIFQRHGLVPEDVGYDELQDFFLSRLPSEPTLFNEYHALLVRVGKQWCRRHKPRCETCPLGTFLP